MRLEMLPGLMQQIAEMIFLRCVRFQPQRFKGLFRLFRQVAQQRPRIRYLKRLRLNGWKIEPTAVARQGEKAAVTQSGALLGSDLSRN